MAPSLRPVAARVVERARLQPGERVVDLGTGTGTGAELARGEGRTITGIDAADGMLALARRNAPDATFERMDFERLDLDDASFDVALAIHALLFAADRVAALHEWLRIVRPGGRLSLSVPGPESLTPSAIYGQVYRRHGIHVGGRYPTQADLAAWAREAGWNDVETDADAGHAIVLRDEEDFRLWRSIGSRGEATAGWSQERHDELTVEMLAATPRGDDGAYRIPFGVLYLVARR